MSNELQLLTHKRGQLLERIAHQRAMFSQQWIPVGQAVEKGDRAIASGKSAWQYVQVHRSALVLAAGAVCAVLVVLRPGRTFRLLSRGFVLWRSWRAMQSGGSLVPTSLWATAFNTIRHRYF